LAAHEPKITDAEDERRAAVAMVLREVEGAPHVLFIERARHDGDPWSGHMAFPGGRVDPGDPGPLAAAFRETQEEVGLDLSGAQLLGRLDDLHGHRGAGVPRLVISAFVYRLDSAEPPPLTINYEVEEAFWFPVRDLLEPRNHVLYPARDALEFPGIQVGEPDRHIVWGLTYSFLESFFEVLGRPLPNRWTPELRATARQPGER
jgi:8-oxo-dGTP pyrophosphatase MutT (NUDIX family)